MITPKRAKQILKNDEDFKEIFIGLNYLTKNNNNKTFSLDEIYKQIISKGYEISKNNLRIKINMLTEHKILKIYMNKYGLTISNI